MKAFTTYYPDLNKKYNDTVNQAAGTTVQINNFISMVEALKKQTADAKAFNIKMKKLNKDLIDGKITPAYLDDKPK